MSVPFSVRRQASRHSDLDMWVSASQYPMQSSGVSQWVGGTVVSVDASLDTAFAALLAAAFGDVDGSVGVGMPTPIAGTCTGSGCAEADEAVMTERSEERRVGKEWR